MFNLLSEEQREVRDGPATGRQFDDPLQDQARLRRAEMDIRWMRNIGLVGWFFVLQGHGYAMGWTPVWIVFLGGVSYGLWAHVQAARSANIRRAAVTTTFADPTLAACMCFVTGGIDAVLYPFFFFTQVSVAIRFGVVESIGVAIFNCALTVALYYAEPKYFDGPVPGLLLLGTKLFLIGFAGFVGAILAGWARQHAALIHEHARTQHESRERYQAVLRRFAQVQEDERRNIAGELHDRMSGHLFALRQGLADSRKVMHDPAALEGPISSLEDTVSECTHDVRSIMNELRPTVLDELGFVEAAREYLGRLVETAAFSLDWSFDRELQNWRSAQDAMLFRLLQEALLNIQKHAGANHARVSLTRDPDGAVVLSIEDDGKGFDPEQIPFGHYGLTTMRERAEAANGVLSVQSQGLREVGTRVEVRLPMEKRT